MIKTNIRSVLIILTTCFIFALAEPFAYAHRPLNTEDAGVGALNEIVVELAYDQTEITPVGGDKITQKTGGFAFVYGLGFGEVAVEGPYWFDNGDGESGLGDLTFFAKILLMGKTENDGLLTIKAEATSTTGDETKGLGEEDWVYAPSLVFTKAFGLFQIHLQGGYEYIDDGLSDTNSWFYGAGLDVELSKLFTISGEVFGNYNSDAKPMSYLVGLFFTLNENVLLDVAYTAPANDDAKDGADKWWNIGGGVTLTF